MKVFTFIRRQIVLQVVLCCFVFFGSQPAPAQVTTKTDPGHNNPPPAGAILDLNGTPIPGGGNGTYQHYTVNFVAGVSNTAITFAFRDDPAQVSVANVSVVDLANPSVNLLVNGDFSQGPVGSNTPTGWTYANVFGVHAGGSVASGSGPCYTSAFCWLDGAVLGFDAISQTIATTIGHTYQIGFDVAEDSLTFAIPGNPILPPGYPGSDCYLAAHGGPSPCKFSDVSINGDTTDDGGNGIDVAVYAQAGLPAAASQTIYTNDSNIADFTSSITAYATFSNFSGFTCGFDNTCPSSPSFTPTSTELATYGYRFFTGTLTTGLPAGNNWILASFPSAVSKIVVFPNIDHFGSPYDGYQYQIYGSNDLAAWTKLYDATSVTGVGEPFTLGTFTGTAPSSVNNVLTPQSIGLAAGCSGTATPCAVGYIAQFQFPAAYKYFALGASTVASAQGNPDQELSAVGATSSFTTPPQTITPGQTVTFTDERKINQNVMIPSGAMLNGTVSMAVKFTEVAPATFDTTRLPGIAQSPNWSGGTTPIPAGTTGTPIPSANNNVVVMEQLCFSDAAGTMHITCNVDGAGSKIALTSFYTGTSLPPNPGYFTASDGKNDWADITTDPLGCCTVSGGTDRINTDYFIGDKPPVIAITSPTTTAYLLNQAVAANYTCTDPQPQATGFPTCLGTVASTSNIDTTSPGSKTFTVSSTDAVGTSGTASANYTVQYQQTGTCDGDAGHQILQPVNPDGSSVWKQGRTIPLKFRVCDANGVSIGTPGVITSFVLSQIISGTVANVDETLDSTIEDSGFSFDPTAQQWIFNLSTKLQSAGFTYVYNINLNDGSTITFRYGLR